MKVLASLLMVSAAAAALALPGAAAGLTRPGPSVAAGARRLPDVGFARNAKRGCDRYVSTTGDDANSGRSARVAWRTVGMALRTLRAGQVGCVLPGTYEEGHNEAGHDGTAAGPIVLRRAPGSRAMPVVKPKGTVAVFHIDRDYWVLDGFDVDVNFQKVTGVRFMENADHGVLRNSRVHNSTSGASVYVAGRDILVEGCEIFNNFQTNEQDSHGVAIVQSAARVMVKTTSSTRPRPTWEGLRTPSISRAAASSPSAAARRPGTLSTASPPSPRPGARPSSCTTMPNTSSSRTRSSAAT